MPIRKLLLCLLLFASLPRVSAQSNCVTSATTWTSTAIPPQQTQFTINAQLAPTVVPAVGSGGPVFALSSASFQSQTGNLYPQNAVLIRQGENGNWQVFNGSSNAYTADVVVPWTVATSPAPPVYATFSIAVNVTNKTYTVTVSQPGSACVTACTLASNYQFRTSAPASPLAYWNLDGTGMPLIACGVSLQMPNPILATLTPQAGPVGTLVTVTGSNFGGTQGASVISFGGVPATTVPAWSATSITATVPNTATTGNVLVSVNNLVSNGIQFTVTAGQPPTPPLVTSVSSVVSLSLACGPSQAPPTQHNVSLAWTASNSSGVTGYNIYRSTTSGANYLKIGSTAGALLFSDVGVAPGITYYYVVTAVAGTLESTWSNQVSASIP